MPWFEPLFNEYPKFKEGKLIPPEGPGLGLSLSEKAINEYIAS
jgi:L-alanine-DL-glutamate epimerase-like enolase superfamily enzyme